MSQAVQTPAPVAVEPSRRLDARPLAGTWRLIRLACRRDRIVLPVWIVALVAVPASTAASVLGLYDTESDRLAYARTWASSIVTQVFNGPAAGPAAGAIVMAESFLLLALLPPLMSIFTVVRHTRQNEEAGRAELLGSAVVGRYASLTVAITMMVGANLLVGLGVAATLVAAGLPASGSVVAGATVTGMGASFGVAAAVTAQVFSSARGANGGAAALLAASFLVRAVGDSLGRPAADGLSSTSAWPSWLSPLGWAGQVFPYVKNDGRPLALMAAFMVAGTVLAAVLVGRRDVGAGLIADRRGPAAASRWLRSPIGLAWRLHRGSTAGWLVASAVVGAAMGGVADEVDDLFEGNADAAELIATLGGTDRLVDAYLAVVMGFFAFMAAGYTVQGVLRLRAEEAAGTLEPVLAGAVSRERWLAGHLVCIIGGAAALLAVGGLAGGLTYGLVTADVAAQAASTLGAALVQLPAVLVLAAVVLLAYAVRPDAVAAVGWGLLVLCLLAAQLGELLDLPQVVLDISPFTHTPAAPAEPVTATPLLALTALALAIGAAATVTLHRRNIPT